MQKLDAKVGRDKGLGRSKIAAITISGLAATTAKGKEQKAKIKTSTVTVTHEKHKHLFCTNCLHYRRNTDSTRLYLPAPSRSAPSPQLQQSSSPKNLLI